MEKGAIKGFSLRENVQKPVAANPLRCIFKPASSTNLKPFLTPNLFLQPSCPGHQDAVGSCAQPPEELRTVLSRDLQRSGDFVNS